MKTRVRFSTSITCALMIVAALACAKRASVEETAANNNSAAVQQPKEQPTAQTTKKPPETAAADGSGTIEVASTPPGATIMLISLEEGASGPPRPRGSTPATLSGIPPGKYTLHLERVGYTYFQKKIVVKPNAITKVAATLRKE